MTSNFRPTLPLSDRIILAYPSFHAVTTVANSYSVAAASTVLALELFGTVLTVVIFVAILLRSRIHRPN